MGEGGEGGNNSFFKNYKIISYLQQGWRRWEKVGEGWRRRDKVEKVETTLFFEQQFWNTETPCAEGSLKNEKRSRELDRQMIWATLGSAKKPSWCEGHTLPNSWPRSALAYLPLPLPAARLCASQR